MRSVVALVLALTWVSCGGKSQPRNTVDQAVVAYANAVDADDPKAAYALLSRKVRQKLAYNDFVTRWKQTKLERNAQAKRLREQARHEDNLGTRAIVEYRGGKRMSLSKFDTRWYLERATLTETTQATPRDTLRQLASALENRDVEGVIALLTAGQREAVDDTLRNFSTSLSTNVGHFIQMVSDDRAEMTWEDAFARYRIVMVREAGAWRVADIHIAPSPKSDGDEPAFVD